MSGEKLKSIREKICATCLSRDRKLFPVPDSKPFAMFCYNFTLCEQDRVCWECRHVVLKMAAFRSRALKAQAVLANLLNGDQCDTLSLSQLAPTDVLYININDVSEHVQVKQEQVLVEVVKEEFVHVEIDEDSSNKMTYDEANADEAICDKVDEATDDDLSNVVINENLKRKRLKPEMEQLKIPLNKKSKEEKPTDINKSDWIYTEEKLTEEEMLQWRVRKKDTEFYANNLPVLRCEKCIQPFHTMALFTAHNKRHTETFGALACDICDLRSIDGQELAHHRNTHYSLLRCRYCAHEWDEPNGMRLHCSEKHGVPVTVWSCEMCDREFDSQTKLSRHRNVHRAPAPCPECGKLTHSRMGEHMRAAHADLPLRRCTVCEREVRGDRALEHHVATLHAKMDELPFCTPCNMQFKRIDLYKAHLRNSLKHADQKDLRFKCTHCDKAFLKLTTLTDHIDAVHDRGEKYPCEACGEAFATRKMRRAHKLRTHEKKLPVRDKICDYCGKAFVMKVVLLDHINSHTGARPYVCKLCNATFGFKSALYHHGRIKHKIKKKQKV